MFPDHCLVGYGHPAATALKPRGAIAAMLFNGVRAFPSPQLPPPIYGYASPTGSSIAAASGYQGSTQELIDMIPRSSMLNPVELSSSVPGMTSEMVSSGVFCSAAAAAADHVTAHNSVICSMALPIWGSDYQTDRRLEPQASAFRMGISQHVLDMALYGYANSAQQQNFNANGYALSGLKSSDLSYGNNFANLM